MKRYGILALFGFACLAFAAVWLGGLNQDEGWYLYAANLVAEGEVPYRDFFYTQGPVMPVVYAAFAGVWRHWGILGARIFTLALGIVGILFAVALARRLAPPARRTEVGLAVLLLLGCNLYHLYYNAIPKTYALAGLFVVVGFYLLTFVESARRGVRAAAAFGSGAAFALAAGTRISLGILLAVAGVGLLVQFRRCGWGFLWFGLGGAVVLALVFGGFLWNPETRAGFVAAQHYHAARGGFDPVFAVGSLSRLVRWYLPTFVLLGLGAFAVRPTAADERTPASIVLPLLLAGALAVFAVQILAPFPYEDYQVPVMGILGVFAAVLCATRLPHGVSLCLVALGLSWACSFGSPLLEKWTTNGQDRFWTLKKSSCELAQLRDVARRIETLDPGGRLLLTQDLYLAIETNRRVPHGLEMGPFSYWGEKVPAFVLGQPVLDDGRMRKLLASAPCEIAALSGYSFAITVPEGVETPCERQMDFWRMLERRYEFAFKEAAFGQNATTLLVLKRKGDSSEGAAR